MREKIGLYRGKRKDGEGWVCGYLSTRTICTIFDTHFGYIIQKPPAGLYHNEWFEVDKDTIGEYIGSPDMNGKGIFEYDIVRVCLNPAISTGTVEWDKRIAGFIVTFPNNKCVTFLDIFQAKAKVHNEVWVEVVGNIFDNPELLQNA